MFTGIVTHAGEVAAAREIAGRPRARGRQRPAAGRDRARRLGRPRRRLPDGGRHGRADPYRAGLRRDPGADHARRAGARGSGSISSARCGWATSWAAIWSSATSTRSARSRASRPTATVIGSRSRCRRALAPMLAVKGSIAVDGISLTVNEAGRDRFAVTIIPHTWPHTTLAERQVGDPGQSRSRHAGALRGTAARVRPAGLSGGGIAYLDGARRAARLRRPLDGRSRGRDRGAPPAGCARSRRRGALLCGRSTICCWPARGPCSRRPASRPLISSSPARWRSRRRSRSRRRPAGSTRSWRWAA